MGVTTEAHKKGLLWRARLGAVPFVALLAALFVTPLLTVAAPEPSMTISPLIVDEKTHPRDILKKSLYITNTRNHKIDVYAFVNNVDVEEGTQEFLNRSDVVLGESLANWIEISRGKIEIMPGETKQVPFLIHVNLNAKPGTYHASISFGWGSTHDEAIAVSVSEPRVIVNIEVLDDAKERLQLARFWPEKLFFSGSTASLSYLLENIGNRPLSPTGEIRVYNRRGEEVDTLPVNTSKESLTPTTASQMSAVWNAEGRFGRYKALIDIEYGSNQQGTVQDTIYFWVIPWGKLLTLFVMLAATVVVVVTLVYRRYERTHPGLVHEHAELPENSLERRLPLQTRRAPGAVHHIGLAKAAAASATPVRPRVAAAGAVHIPKRTPSVVQRPASHTIAVKRLS